MDRPPDLELSLNLRDVEREELPVDVLFVGGGPASLAGAIRLADLIKEHDASSDGKLGDLTILVIEKAAEIGAHSLSGAVMDPRGIKELFPDSWEKEVEDLAHQEVTRDSVVWMTRKGWIRSPITPPPLANHGNWIVSLQTVARWLAGHAEKRGIEVYPGFAGARMLYDDQGHVRGVQTRDMGVDKNGEKKPNFEPGMDITARITVLGEGVRGNLAKQLLLEGKIQPGRNAQVYSLGVKEVWKVPGASARKGEVIHTIGHPLDGRTFGGGWIYFMGDDLVSIGLVVGLDAEDPFTNPHQLFQEYKVHPRVAEVLEGGEILSYGAKAIPEGGYFSMPELVTDGCLLVGDDAGFLDSMRLKGIHLAMKSGMLAAEAVFEALESGDSSRGGLASYARAFEKSWARDQLHPVRNFHQAWKGGRIAAFANGGLQLLTSGRGWGWKDHVPSGPGHERMRKIHGTRDREVALEGDKSFLVAHKGLAFDKLTDVYHSSTLHEEDQQPHLRVADLDICRTRCKEEYGNPCQFFCPASVYEMVEDEERGGTRLHLNFSNCVHCKTCDIIDPYQIINWVVPEGGGGPGYKMT